jgi:hypothetical protein
MKKINLKIISSICVILLLNIYFAPFCYANFKYENASNETLYWRTPIYLIANRYLELYVHESGHALTGLALGRDVKSFEVSLLTGGRVYFNNTEKMRSEHIQNSLVFLSGPLFDRLLALGVNCYLDANEDNISEYTRAFLGTTYTYTTITSYLYFLISYISYILPGTGIYTDWTAMAYEISGGNYIIGLIFLSLIGAAYTWDCVNSLDEIEKNYNRMIGKYPARISWKF